MTNETPFHQELSDMADLLHLRRNPFFSHDLRNQLEELLSKASYQIYSLRQLLVLHEVEEKEVDRSLLLADTRKAVNDAIRVLKEHM